MLTVSAPAKLNLTLEVLGRRPDGYHDIRSVIQSINLSDSLTLALSRELKFRSNVPDWTAEQSLVSRAARVLQETTACTRGAAIEVSKRIPLLSGLGGDSSDAAATLYGLNRLWELELPEEKLLVMAASLGSDVPFFLAGGTVLAEGRGEVLTPLPPMPRMWAVLVIPAVPRAPGKTKGMYHRLNTSHYSDGRITEKLVAVLRERTEFTPSLLFNTFENVAFTPRSEIKLFRDHLIKMGADNVHLAGSGPALFTLLKDKGPAEELVTRCRQQGMETYLAETTTTNEH